MTDGEFRRRAVRLVAVTALWNVVEGAGAVVAGILARSIALTGFGLDSLVEVFTSGVAAWQLAHPTRGREARALRMIAIAFLAVGVYIRQNPSSGSSSVTVPRPHRSASP